MGATIAVGGTLHKGATFTIRNIKFRVSKHNPHDSSLASPLDDLKVLLIYSKPLVGPLSRQLQSLQVMCTPLDADSPDFAKWAEREIHSKGRIKEEVESGETALFDVLITDSKIAEGEEYVDIYDVDFMILLNDTVCMSPKVEWVNFEDSMRDEGKQCSGVHRNKKVASLARPVTRKVLKELLSDVAKDRIYKTTKKEMEGVPAKQAAQYRGQLLLVKEEQESPLASVDFKGKARETVEGQQQCNTGLQEEEDAIRAVGEEHDTKKTHAIPSERPRPREIGCREAVQGDRNNHYLHNTDFRVLVAEDNKTNQKVISAMLRRLNVEFDIAEDGHQVLELISKKSYSLIFMDIQMPYVPTLPSSITLRNTVCIDSVMVKCGLVH